MKDRARGSYLEDLEEAKGIGRESLRVEMRDKVGKLPTTVREKVTDTDSINFGEVFEYDIAVDDYRDDVMEALK